MLWHRPADGRKICHRGYGFVPSSRRHWPALARHSGLGRSQCEFEGAALWTGARRSGNPHVPLSTDIGYFRKLSYSVAIGGSQFSEGSHECPTCAAGSRA
jgi:hypothetical protein